jgi:hypothetical protein
MEAMLDTGIAIAYNREGMIYVEVSEDCKIRGLHGRQRIKTRSVL